MRHAALLLLLCSCSSLSNAELDQLAKIQESAKMHYEGGNFGQALTLIERGLELDPDEYQLNCLLGTILMRTSPSALGTDHRQLDRATAVLEKVYDMRSLRNHRPMLLLPLAETLQLQGRRHLAEADRLIAQKTRDGETAPQTSDEVVSLQRRSDEEYDRAAELLECLIDRGEMRLICRQRLMRAALDRGRHDELVAEYEKYFKLMAESQEFHDKEIQRTNVPKYERAERDLLAQLRHDEMTARALLAEYHDGRGESEKALEMLDRVLEIDPKRSADYYNRGRILLKLGREKEAVEDFRKFLATTDLPPTSEKAILAARIIAK